MSEVFDLIFDLFSWVVQSLKSIPLSDNVSLFDFCLALAIMSVTLTAVVVTAKISSIGAQSSYYREARRNSRNSNEGE